MEDHYRTKKEIAQMRGLSEKTIEAWIRKGIFPQGEPNGPRLRRWRDSVIEAAFAKMAEQRKAS